METRPIYSAHRGHRGRVVCDGHPVDGRVVSCKVGNRGWVQLFYRNTTIRKTGDVVFIPDDAVEVTCFGDTHRQYMDNDNNRYVGERIGPKATYHTKPMHAESKG